MSGDRAHIDRVDTLNSLHSYIDTFRSNARMWSQTVRRDAETVFTAIRGMESALQSRLTTMRAQLDHAKWALQSCLDRQERERKEDRSVSISCDAEASNVHRYERAVRELEKACAEARLIVDSARRHCSSLDSITGGFEGRNESACNSARSELTTIIFHAENYLAEKAPVLDRIAIVPSGLKSAERKTAAGVGADLASVTNPMPEGGGGKHVIELPEGLAGGYTVKNMKSSSILSSADGTRLARISMSGGGNSVISLFDGAPDGLLGDVENILRSNGIKNISLWVTEAGSEAFIAKGFVIRDGSLSKDGCIVEKAVQ